MSTTTFLSQLNSLDLQPVARKLMSSSDGDRWTEQQLEMAILRYKMFLYIKYHYSDLQLVPTKEIDEVWHAHILVDTKRYLQDCENLFGYVLHHRDNGSADEVQSQNQEAAFAVTQNLFEKFFGAGVLTDANQATQLQISACMTLP
jgi:hypothetical protein